MRFLPVLAFALAAPVALATPATGPAAAASAPMAPAAVSAPAYTAAPGSTLGFASSYDGEAFEGRFSRFQADITFDPASARGRFDVVIELASAGTENEERDETLLGADFFHTTAMPRARYEASTFRALADGRFVAEGQLTLRGVTKPVPLTFRWTPGETPTLQGVAVVKRLDFGVGAGDWDDTEVMPNAVTVRTRLTLQPKP